MKDIGLKLKEKREENGVSIEEAADDLKMRPNQIVSLEEGKREDFKDVMTLKYFIRDYAKYLGLDEEKILDDFNEFLFDFTSKIPLDEINKLKEKDVNKKSVISPYTSINKGRDKNILIGIGALVILLIVGYIIFSGYKGNDFISDDTTYIVRR